MIRKRCTVEIIIDLPEKGQLSDVTRFVQVRENQSVTQQSYKIVKTEPLGDQLLPHEQQKGEEKTVRVLFLDLLKKLGLPPLSVKAWSNTEWDENDNPYADGIVVNINPTERTKNVIKNRFEDDGPDNETILRRTAEQCENCLVNPDETFILCDNHDQDRHTYYCVCYACKKLTKLVLEFHIDTQGSVSRIYDSGKATRVGTIADPSLKELEAFFTNHYKWLKSNYYQKKTK